MQKHQGTAAGVHCFLLRRDGTKDKQEIERRKSELSRSERRCAEIDGIIKRLYEDSLCGKISDDRFAVLSKDYEAEQAKLKTRIAELNAGLKAIKDRDDGLNRFLLLVDRYTEIPELTPEILNAFIDRIEVEQK